MSYHFSSAVAVATGKIFFVVDLYVEKLHVVIMYVLAVNYPLLHGFIRETKVYLGFSCCLMSFYCCICGLPWVHQPTVAQN